MPKCEPNPEHSEGWSRGLLECRQQDELHSLETAQHPAFMTALEQHRLGDLTQSYSAKEAGVSSDECFLTEALFLRDYGIGGTSEQFTSDFHDTNNENSTAVFPTNIGTCIPYDCSIPFEAMFEDLPSFCTNSPRYDLDSEDCRNHVDSKTKDRATPNFVSNSQHHISKLKNVDCSTQFRFHKPTQRLEKDRITCINDEPSSNKENIGSYSPRSRKARIQKHLEKRKRRIWHKKSKYTVRAIFANIRLRT
jgi:hypothetical protein